MDEIEARVKRYLLDEFLPGESPENLTATTPLISGGILDSLATLKLVGFLEETWEITVEAHEASVDHMNTIADIASFVAAKRGGP